MIKSLLYKTFCGLYRENVSYSFFPGFPAAPPM